MLSINIQECKHCQGIRILSDKLEYKISRMARDEYHSAIYLSSKNHTRAEIKRLIRYKNILNNLFWNSTYYDISAETIMSKIKSLI